MSGPSEWFGVERRVLLLLLDNPKMKRKDFQKAGMDRAAANNALSRLREYGLTDFEELGDWHDTMIWWLTDRGKEAAMKLAELVQFIEDGKK